MTTNLIKKIKKIKNHLSRYMILYSALAIILGTLVSWKYSPTFLSNYIPIVVFFMIYPMMVNISFEELKKIKQYRKQITLALIYNFVLGPVLYYFLCRLFNAPHDVLIALLFLSIAPASSMGVGYVGLAKGNVALASAIVASAFTVFLAISPAVIHVISTSFFRSMVLEDALKSLFFTLILPLIFGILTREYLIERRNVKFENVKPALSLVTLVFLYILIFMIFAVKGKVIILSPQKVFIVVPIAVLFYALMLVTEYFINKHLIRLSYEDFQAVVFTTVSKNVALTIALLSTIFRNYKSIAMYPALVSIFQILFLITYLHFSLAMIDERREVD